MFWKSVTSVLTGTAMAQAIPIIGSLVIARLYTVEDFGIYSAWLGIVLILSVLSTGRFEASIAIQAPGKNQLLAFQATNYFILVMGVVLSCLLVFITQTDFSWLKIFELEFLLLLIPTGMVMAFSQTQQSLLAASGQYKLLSVLRVMQALLIVIPQIIIGYWFKSPIHLAATHFIGVLITILIVRYFDSTLKLFTFYNNKLLLTFYIKYKKFLIYSLPADSMNSLAAQLPVIVVTVNFGSEKGGILALTMRTLGAPIGILGKSVLDVFKKYASDEYRLLGNCSSIYLKTLYYLTFLAGLFSIFIFFFSKILFAVLFGSEWTEAGDIAILLLPLFALRFIASPLSYLIYIAEKQNIDLVWQVCLLFMTLTVLYSGLSFEDTIKLYSAGYAILYLAYIRLTYKMSLNE
jgi:O-antigen/teichoic acid export membrane protein